MLADAGFRHDLALALGPGGGVVGVEVRPHLPPGYAGCGARAAAPVAAPPALPAARLVLVAPDDAAPIPVVPGGKGVPFPGQPELTDADVLALSSDGLDDEGRAALEAQLRSAAAGKQGKQEPTFFQKVRPRRGAGCARACVRASAAA